MKLARVTAIFGGILLAAALSGGANAADPGFKEAFLTETGLTETGLTETGQASQIAPLEDLDKLRARGSQDEAEKSPRGREAIGPILLIFLLQQNRFADGLDIQQPVTAR